MLRLGQKESILLPSNLASSSLNRVRFIATILSFNLLESFEFNAEDRYGELLKLIPQFLDQKLEANDFEEKCRAMYSTSAYAIYTVDKLVQALVKQVCLALLYGSLTLSASTRCVGWTML